MAINGTINVSALFHDTDGTTAINVVSLRSSDEYTTGKVAIVTGTAGTAAVSFGDIGETTYRDASGSLVTFATAPTRIAFAWSGSSLRQLINEDDAARICASASGRVAVTDFSPGGFSPGISAGTGTGTYTIVLYGT